MHWVVLYIAIGFEVAGTMSLRQSLGFERPAFLALALGLYGISFLFLAQALRVIPVAVAYAIWSGLGIVIIALLGFLWFREPFSAMKLVFLSMIIVGAVGLNLITRAH
jgi:multidrug transporter EmrE-like cation transporter